MKKLLRAKKFNTKTDWIFAIMIIAFVLFGVVMVYSASYYSAGINYNDKFFFAKKQLLGAVLGIVAMIVLSRFDYNKLKKLWIIFAIVGTVLLIVVLIPGIGQEVLGARRWINLGLFTIQPSEIAKFCFVVFASCFLTKNINKNKSLLAVWPVFLVALVYAVLIMLQPNMSTTMCIILCLAVMLFVGGVNLKQFSLLIIPAIAALFALIIAEPYRLKRLLAFINPWENPLEEGFQLIQSLYSLGSGGFFGVGLFNSRQKLLFLPFSESDFIFSIIGEELGWLGAGLVICVFMFILIRGVKIAIKSKNRFGTYLAIGIVATIIIQALINIAVVSGSIPPTGLPLPFISSGSTSLIVFMSAIGVLLNIDRQSKANKIL